MKSYKTKRAIGNAIGYIILILISIIWLFPFVGLVLQSFRSYATEYGGMVDYLVPKHFSLDNYKFLFDSSQTNYLLWYKNLYFPVYNSNYNKRIFKISNAK